MAKDNENTEQKRFEKHVNTDKEKTRRVYIYNAKELAVFILDREPGYVWMSAHAVKKKCPELYMDIKRVRKYMESEEFHKTVFEQIPDITKRTASGMFNALLYKYFDAQINLNRGPDAKALAILGQVSGRYDPIGKQILYDGDKLDAEREHARVEATVQAFINRIKREMKEKEEKEKNGK